MWSLNANVSPMSVTDLVSCHHYHARNYVRIKFGPVLVSEILMKSRFYGSIDCSPRSNTECSCESPLRIVGIKLLSKFGTCLLSNDSPTKIWTISTTGRIYVIPDRTDLMVCPTINSAYMKLAIWFWSRMLPWQARWPLSWLVGRYWTMLTWALHLSPNNSTEERPQTCCNGCDHFALDLFMYLGHITLEDFSHFHRCQDI